MAHLSKLWCERNVVIFTHHKMHAVKFNAFSLVLTKSLTLCAQERFFKPAKNRTHFVIVKLCTNTKNPMNNVCHLKQRHLLHLFPIKKGLCLLNYKSQNTAGSFYRTVAHFTLRQKNSHTKISLVWSSSSLRISTFN